MLEEGFGGVSLNLSSRLGSSNLMPRSKNVRAEPLSLTGAGGGGGADDVDEEVCGCSEAEDFGGALVSKTPLAGGWNEARFPLVR